MNFNVEYSSFIECWIATQSGDFHSETWIRLLSVPRPGDFICLELPDRTARSYEVNRVTHYSQHTSKGEVKPGKIFVHCTEITQTDRITKS